MTSVSVPRRLSIPGTTLGASGLVVGSVVLGGASLVALVSLVSAGAGPQAVTARAKARRRGSIVR